MSYPFQIEIAADDTMSLVLDLPTLRFKHAFNSSISISKSTLVGNTGRIILDDSDCVINYQIFRLKSAIYIFSEQGVFNLTMSDNEEAVPRVQEMINDFSRRLSNELSRPIGRSPDELDQTDICFTPDEILNHKEALVEFIEEEYER